MHRTSRRFAEWVTGFKGDSFRWARAKLTLVYLGIIAVVVTVLSSAVYSFQTARFVRFAQERQEERVTENRDEEAFEKSLTQYVLNLRLAIISGGVITVFVTGALSYFLAGRTLRPIRRAHDLQRRFVANAAHDLRTPLAVMKTEAEVALSGPDLKPGEMRELMQSQIEEIDHMSTMVEQMLDLVRTGRGHRAKVSQSVDLATLVAGAVGKIRTVAETKRITLELEGIGPARVLGDDHALDRSIRNVLHNAVTYTPEGGRIVVSTNVIGSHVEVVVRDSGIGISKRDLPHVTEPFYRADAARGVESGGSGLGLAIVQETVTDHGGTLRIESEAGAGTSVILRLPGV